jgi:hypothetical protein
VGLGGIEPPTSALSVLRSNRLSYSPAFSGRGQITRLSSELARRDRTGWPAGDRTGGVVVVVPCFSPVRIAHGQHGSFGGRRPY